MVDGIVGVGTDIFETDGIIGVLELGEKCQTFRVCVIIREPNGGLEPSVTVIAVLLDVAIMVDFGDHAVGIVVNIMGIVAITVPGHAQPTLDIVAVTLIHAVIEAVRRRRRAGHDIPRLVVGRTDGVPTRVRSLDGLCRVEISCRRRVAVRRQGVNAPPEPVIGEILRAGPGCIAAQESARRIVCVVDVELAVLAGIAGQPARVGVLYAPDAIHLLCIVEMVHPLYRSIPDKCPPCLHVVKGRDFIGSFPVPRTLIGVIAIDIFVIEIAVTVVYILGDTTFRRNHPSKVLAVGIVNIRLAHPCRGVQFVRREMPAQHEIIIRIVIVAYVGVITSLGYLPDFGDLSIRCVKIASFFAVVIIVDIETSLGCAGSGMLQKICKPDLGKGRRQIIRTPTVPVFAIR